MELKRIVRMRGDIPSIIIGLLALALMCSIYLRVVPCR